MVSDTMAGTLDLQACTHSLGALLNPFLVADHSREAYGKHAHEGQFMFEARSTAGQQLRVRWPSPADSGRHQEHLS